jgi:catechol 2,3-dioxygenase-like lactoylglutathione lyase family enzyme
MDVHVRLLVDDFGACFRFYRDVLGLKVSFGSDTAGYADFRVGDTAFALFLRSEMEEATGRGQGSEDGPSRDQAVLVLGVDDLESFVEELRRRGVSLVAPLRPHSEWGIRTAHLRDPEGHLIELNEPLQEGVAGESSG